MSGSAENAEQKGPFSIRVVKACSVLNYIRGEAHVVSICIAQSLDTKKDDFR